MIFVIILRLRLDDTWRAVVATDGLVLGMSERCCECLPHQVGIACGYESCSLGIVTGGLQGEFERALDGIEFDSDVLQYFQDAFGGFKEAIRILPPARLVDAMTDNVAILDGLRRRVTSDERHRYSMLQAHYAESLSCLSEEAGDLPSAMWWIDRASQWAQAAGWSGMTTGGYVRRSMMVMSFSGDGLRVVDQACQVLDMPQASPRMKGLAAKQMAHGYALAGIGRRATVRSMRRWTGLANRFVRTTLHSVSSLR